MDRFTHEIAEAMRQEDLPASSPDDVLTDVRRRAVAQRRRKAGLAVATVVVAAVAAAGILTALPERDAAPVQPAPGPTTGPNPIEVPDDAVPWSDRGDFEVWQAPPPESRESTTPCTAADLRVHRVQDDGASGQSFLFVDVIKQTDGRCTLAGYPTLTGLGPAGVRVTIPTDHDQRLDEYDESPATLDRGEIAQVTITSDNRNCEAAQGTAPIPTDRWQAVHLVLPNGGDLPLGGDDSTVCGMAVTRFARDNAPIEQPVRWNSLRAAVTLPERVTAGENLTYVVTLRNDGPDDVELAPCGGFTQQLAFQDMNGKDLAKPVFDERRLNCDEEPTLRAGATRDYVMQLQVPKTAPAMVEARLTWQLRDTSPDQGAQEFIEVVPQPR